VRFFVDECISPSLSHYLNQSGHNAIHPRDRGRLRDPDHVVFSRCVQEDRILITENADDFRKLAAGVEVHPGLIILPSVARAQAQRLMERVLDYLQKPSVERPQDVLVNAALAITIQGAIQVDPLP
jgi:predicted nuclease of predicted toxin-antitoxin system